MLGVFTLNVDNLREMGSLTKYVMAGVGIGEWFYTPDAQDVTDSMGRESSEAAGKRMRVEMVRQMLEEVPVPTPDKMAGRLGVHPRSVRNYLSEIRAA